MFTTKHYFQVPLQHGFEDFHGWWLNHFPGQPVPTLDHPLSCEIFPNVQPKHPMAKSWGYFLLFYHLLLEKRPISHYNLLPGSCIEEWGPPPYDLAFSLGNLPFLTPFSSLVQQGCDTPGLSQCRIRSRQALLGAYLLLWLQLFVKHNDGVGTHTSRTFLTKTTAQLWWRLLETRSCGSRGWQPHPTLGLAK